jgi:glycosyltransferase involved in cell wall biosynthesis
MISCIVPTYNNADTIGKCIGSVKKAAFYYSPHDVEIVVSDNGSTDGTLDVLNKTDGIKIVHCSNQGIGKNKNYGAKYATGDILFFVDADNIVSYHVFREIDQLSRSHLIIGGGVRHVTPMRKSLGIMAFFFMVALRCWLSSMSIGAFWVRRWVFDSLNGFSEDNNVLDDIDFSLKMERFCNGRAVKRRSLRDTKLLWSTRKFDKYGDWYWFKHLFSFIKAIYTTRCNRNITGIWYELS